MLKLIILNNEVYVRGRTSQHDVMIDQVTRFKHQKAEWTENFQDGKWDGYVRLYSKKAGNFPLGMLDEVEVQLIIEDVEYEIIDRREFDAVDQFSYPYNDNPPMRDYQWEAVRTAIQKKRGTISLPTGTGKTRVAMGIMGVLRLPTVFYVNRERLLYQTMETIRRTFGCRVGQVGDGKMSVRPITVAMVQSATNLPPKLFNDFGIAIFDEAHHVAADTVYEIAQETMAEYVFGLSATPTREDGLEMMIQAGMGSIIYRKSTSDMIDEGWLARPEVEALRVSPITFTQKEKYADVLHRAITHNRERNELIAAKAVNESVIGKVYVHVNRLEHGPIIEKLINNKFAKNEPHRKAKWLCGKHSKAEKDKVLKDFRDGDLRILVSTLLGEGVDVPSMYCFILAGGGGKGKKVTVPQLMGRVLRPSEHSTVKFIDVADRCKFLWDHFLERCQYYGSEPAFELDDYIKLLTMA